MKVGPAEILNGADVMATLGVTYAEITTTREVADALMPDADDLIGVRTHEADVHGGDNCDCGKLVENGTRRAFRLWSVKIDKVELALSVPERHGGAA